MKLYVMRHGETPWNVEYKLQGIADISLNENGVRLAKVTAEALKEVPFDLCISSPLIRAKETARLVLGERNVPIVEDERIQEITFGEWEGRCCRPGQEEIPLAILDKFFHSPQDYIPPKGGETIGQVVERTKAFLDELMANENYQEKTILITSHGCAIRALLQSVYEDKCEDFWHGKVPPNCSVNLIEVKNQKAVLTAEDVVYY